SSLHFADVEIHAFHGLDIDRWSFFLGIGLLKNLVYDGNMKFWWKSENKKFEGNLKHFMNDLDAMDLAKFALTNKCKAHIYVEHTMSSADIVEQLDYDRIGSDNNLEEDVGGSGIDVTLGAGIHQQSVADNERHKIEDDYFSENYLVTVMTVRLMMFQNQNQFVLRKELCKEFKFKVGMEFRSLSFKISSSK
ncbi:hypothetical protein D0Y65_023253, partial [Glycine soja]